MQCQIASFVTKEFAGFPHPKILKSLKLFSGKLGGPLLLAKWKFRAQVTIFGKYCIQYEIIQRNAKQYNTIQCHTIPYDAIQYITIQYNTTPYNTTKCNTTRDDTKASTKSSRAARFHQKNTNHNEIATYVRFAYFTGGAEEIGEKI